MTDTRGPGRVGRLTNPGENRSSGATSLERGWGGKGESKGRWLFLLGAGQRGGGKPESAASDWLVLPRRLSRLGHLQREML